MECDRRYAVFPVGGQTIALPLLDVYAVLERPEITPVPLAPRGVAGLTSVRGRILTVVDVRQRLGLGDGGAHTAPICVAVRTDHEPLCLLVDGLGEVHTTADGAVVSDLPRLLRPV